MTPLINKVKERLQHYSHLQEQTNTGEQYIFVTTLTLMIIGLEQQPDNLIWQHDVLQSFQNMNNSSFFQAYWSRLEWHQLRAELYKLSQYLLPQREE